MSDDDTPRTEEVRDLYVLARDTDDEESDNAAEFGRWLVEHDRQVAAKVLQEVVLDICHDPRTDLTNQSHSLSVISAHLALLATGHATAPSTALQGVQEESKA